MGVGELWAEEEERLLGTTFPPSSANVLMKFAVKTPRATVGGGGVHSRLRFS